MQPARPSTEIQFPLKGVDLSTAFEQQPPLTTPVGVNARGFEPGTLRVKGGARPGLSQFLPRLPSGHHLIQHLNTIVTTSTDALLDDFDDDGDGSVEDPSNLGRGRGRRVRQGGSGRQPSKRRKKSVRILWNNPGDIEQGTPLSAAPVTGQLIAQAQDPDSTGGFGILVGGTFTYDPPAGTVLAEGPHQALRVVYEPTDTITYRTPAKKTVFINVTPSGSPPGVGTAHVSAVDAPNSCTVDNVVIDGLPAPGGEIDYHAGGWPVGRKPIAGNTYAIMTDTLLVYRFTAFLPDQPE